MIQTITMVLLIIAAAIVNSTLVDTFAPHWPLWQKLCVTCPIGGLVGYVLARAFCD